MGNDGDFFMYAIRCPSIRAKNKGGKFNRNADCNHILGFFQNVSHETVRQCPSCKCWYLITIKDPIAQSTIDLVEKETLDFSIVLKPITLKYKII